MKIKKFKKVRDDIVHKLAMLPAQRMLNVLHEQKERAISGSLSKCGCRLRRMEAVMAQSLGGPTLDTEIDQMKEWHHCLIEPVIWSSG